MPMQFVYRYATLTLLLLVVVATSATHNDHHSVCCRASVAYSNHDNRVGVDAMTAPIISAPAAATAALFTATAGGIHPAQRTPIKTPQDIMVDITNRFAFGVMNVHTTTLASSTSGVVDGNRDNFVFSPCGLTSVLIALYEGSNGQSAYEIYRAMRLPWDRDVVRIGVRDIHRRLRVSFA